MPIQHVVRKLKHRNICEYMGVCISAPHFSLIYEFLEHGTLRDRLRNKPMQRLQSLGKPTVGSPGGTGANNNNNCTASTATNRPSSAIGTSNNNSNGFGDNCCITGGVTGGGSVASCWSLEREPLGAAELFQVVEDVTSGMRYLHQVCVRGIFG